MPNHSPVQTSIDISQKVMSRLPTKKAIDAFFVSASQIFCYYSWFVKISPHLKKMTLCKVEKIHFYITQDAIIMGFLINLRALDEFFHKKKKHPDDVRAYEFGFVSPGGFLSDLQRKEIDKKIAHPTEATHESKDTDYLVYNMAHKAFVHVLQFIDFLLNVPSPLSSSYKRTIINTKKKYLEIWSQYTALVPKDKRLPIKISPPPNTFTNIQKNIH